jgi:RNA polymerase sigma-70 factor, ECF subfamily
VSELSTCSDAAVAAAPAGLGGQPFDDVVRRHQAPIAASLRRLVGDADVAATLTQECFLRAWRARAAFRGEASVKTWLLRIARRLAIDHYRRSVLWRRLFTPSLLDDHAAVADPGASPERWALARGELRAVTRALAALSPQQRRAFRLRFGEEMSLEDVAAAMAIDVGTVKSHLARGLRALRRQLSEEQA